MALHSTAVLVINLLPNNTSLRLLHRISLQTHIHNHPLDMEGLNLDHLQPIKPLHRNGICPLLHDHLTNRLDAAPHSNNENYLQLQVNHLNHNRSLTMGKKPPNRLHRHPYQIMEVFSMVHLKLLKVHQLLQLLNRKWLVLQVHLEISKRLVWGLFGKNRRTHLFLTARLQKVNILRVKKGTIHLG
jgi:hypothetical protein